ESYFAGPVNIGTSGGIYQGTGTFASPTTGRKIYNSGGIGRLATYSSGTLQVEISSAGKLLAGAGYAQLDAAGLEIATSTSLLARSAVSFATSHGTTPYGG